jgi:hypothetical protein
MFIGVGMFSRLTVPCLLHAGAGKKKILNVGKSGGSAGLEDFTYDNALDDDYDFM